MDSDMYDQSIPMSNIPSLSQHHILESRALRLAALGLV